MDAGASPLSRIVGHILFQITDKRSRLPAARFGLALPLAVVPEGALFCKNNCTRTAPELLPRLSQALDRQDHRKEQQAH